MKKRPDEKLSILQKLGSYNIQLDILESMFFKLIHKKPQIVLWLYYPRNS